MSCSFRDTSPRDLSIMTFIKTLHSAVVQLPVFCPVDVVTSLDITQVNTTTLHWRDIFFTLSECLINVLITGKSNFDERNGQLVRVAFVKKLLLTKPIFESFLQAIEAPYNLVQFSNSIIFFGYVDF